MRLKRILLYPLVMLASFSLIAIGCGRKVPEKVETKKSTPAEVEPIAKKLKAIYSFEGSAQYWEIPEWALESQELVAKSVEPSKDYSSDGSSSLKVVADFPGKVWTAALVEIEEYLDWTVYKRASCDIYIPKDAPEGLKAKLILTVGENWKFTEMSTAIFLIPGRWTTVSASLEPGTSDWKMTEVDDNFRRDIRKVAVRVESNKGPIYSGPIYIDNLRVEEE